MSTVALFPGQGSQHVGMAKDLFENFSYVRELFEEASDALKADLKKLCFDGPESDLTLTHNTQPCLLLASVAAFRAAQRELDFKPQAAAGHSLGEYSALVAAGCLEFGDAIRLVRERGLAMQKAVPAGQGTMAAVMGLEDAQIEALCKKATDVAAAKPRDSQVEACVEPANFNSPGQIVIAGSTDAVAEALSMLKSDPEFSGGKAIPLSVSAPFHCKLMRPARDRMAQLFSELAHKPSKLDFPYFPNRTGRPTQEPGVVLELLVEQIDHPVLWKQSVTEMMNRGFARGVEFGPGKVLAGLSKRIEKTTGKPLPVTGVSDSATLKTLEGAAS